jgi:hypothetical protein
MWLAVPHVTEKVQDKIVEEYVELYLMLRPAYLATFFQAPTHLGVEDNATTARSANIKPCNTAGCCNIAAQSLAFAIAFRSLASMQVSISFFKAVFLFCKNSIAFVSHIIVPLQWQPKEVCDRFFKLSLCLQFFSFSLLDVDSSNTATACRD